MSVLGGTRMSRRAALASSGALAALVAFRLDPLSQTILPGGLVEAAMPLPGAGEWKPTVCAGCTTFCSKQIYVQDGRVLHIRGNEHSKVTGTSGCVRQ